MPVLICSRVNNYSPWKSVKHFLSVLILTSGSNLLFVPVGSAQTTPTPAQQDSTTQSARERDRILLKRNPIASEYQAMGPPGEFFGAPSDAEGVDFRAQFRLPLGEVNASSARFEGNLNYQEYDGSAIPGGSLKLAKAYGPLSLQFQVQRSATERTIDLYQARWLARLVPEISDDTVLLMGFPRYSRDTFKTASINSAWRADYRLNENTVFTYEGLNTNFDDVATRDRLEFQVGVGEISDHVLASDGNTIEMASTTSSRIRRYFHHMITARDIDRHRLGITKNSDDSFLDVSVYYSRWVNDRDWLPWNFVDTNVNATYDVNNRYLPNTIATNVDIYDISNAVFANYRPTTTVTTDTDLAFIVDWENRIDIAQHPIWLGAGIAWRNKERDNENERSVYGAADQNFSLQEVVRNNRTTSIMNGQYLLPIGMDTAFGAPFFEENQHDLFSLNESQSFLESIQDVYTSEETVGSAYVNAYQQLPKWFWRVGFRFEQTDTATRGAVNGPQDSGILAEGETITRIILNGDVVEENFDSFDAAFVTGENSYNHLLPSIELRYQVNPRLKLKMSYFEQLMRPQYFDTVRYRRINPPTLTISEGSPDLEATSIQNYFTGIEYSYDDQGTFYAGVYYKNVADFFYDTTVNENVDGAVYDVSRVENGKDGSIRGFNGYVTHQFAPALIQRADLQMSYTYSDTQANIEDRSIAMPERSEHLFALKITLADKQWQYQSQFSWQSEALDDLGPTAAQDTYREKVVIWNQNVRWKFSEKLSARFSLNNILNYPERSYQGEKARVVNNLYSGSSAKLSVVVAF